MSTIGRLIKGARTFGVLALVLTAVGVTGCRGMGQASAERPGNRIQANEADLASLYDQAATAYDAAEYATAAELFETVRANSTDLRLTRMALYGLACARMMTAQTPEAFDNALDLWRRWVQSAPHYTDQENPLLLAPVINSKVIFPQAPSSARGGGGGADPAGVASVPLWVHQKARQKLEVLEKKSEEAEQDVAQRQKKIDALEKEITRLTEQIKALETIDQKMQKKKSALPSTD